MGFEVRCPNCEKPFFTSKRTVNRIRCRHCRLSFDVADTYSKQPAEDPLIWDWSDPCWPVIASVLWLVGGLNMALASPGMAIWTPGFFAAYSVLQIGLSVLCIVWNLAASIAIVARTGLVVPAWPMTLMQLLLFPTLFFQIAVLFGTRHYQWNHDPIWWDWPVFALWHTFRAFDLLDFSSAYGLRWQPVEHASMLTSVTVIVFHFVVDFFFLGLLVKSVAYFNRKAPAEKQTVLGGWEECLKDFHDLKDKPGLLIKHVLFLLFILLWLSIAFAIRPWNFQDFILWPLDNLLRVIDVFDVIDTFGFRFHNVPTTPIEGTLTWVCRAFFCLVPYRTAHPGVSQP